MESYATSGCLKIRVMSVRELFNILSEFQSCLLDTRDIEKAHEILKNLILGQARRQGNEFKSLLEIKAYLENGNTEAAWEKANELKKQSPAF
ncbi:MAG: hypothetical protein ACYCX4_00030 [Bacillota bacterium]